MSVRDIEEAASHVDEDDVQKKFRKLAWEQPDFNFSVIEALMDQLDISKEQQREIILEGVRRWQQT